jgi:Cu/Ag efflux protein CusF
VQRALPSQDGITLCRVNGMIARVLVRGVCNPQVRFFHVEVYLMKKYAIALSALLGLVLLFGGVIAAEKIKSGPQVGEEVPGPFHPVNVNGPNAGEKFCLYCKNGNNPVAMIFAREISSPLVKLIKKIDAATAKHEDDKMGSFVVFLSDATNLEKKLKEIADKEGIKHTILAVDNPAGPQAYKVAKDADVTVVLYTGHKVKANYSFAKDQLHDKDINTIVASVAKILPRS